MRFIYIDFLRCAVHNYGGKMQLYNKETLERMIKSWPETIRTLKVLSRVNRLHKKPYGKLNRTAKQLSELLQDYQSIMEDLKDGNN